MSDSSITSGPTNRWAWLVVVVALGLSPAAMAQSETCGLFVCLPGELCCDARCVDPTTDSDHCGACGRQCEDSESCYESSCRCGDTVCEGADSCCGDGCADLQNDPNHCGACGNACGADEFCSGGQCLCFNGSGVDQCGDGESCCPGLGCRALDEDWGHCGACGVSCGVGELCESGQCRCGATTQTGAVCDSGDVCCGLPGACVPPAYCQADAGVSCRTEELPCRDADDRFSCANLTRDDDNCGACNRKCNDGRVCVDGECDCPLDTIICDGECVDGLSDPEHCGACHIACGPSELCVNAACQLVCPPGFEQCGSDCIDIDEDEANCGGCGLACDVGEICSNGSCELNCPNGQAQCGSFCRDLDTDVANCGACGAACEGGELCSGGECVPTCRTGQTDCFGRCADLDTDSLNCGGCGLPCGTGEVCAAGSCVLSCPTGAVACGADCVQVDRDERHCGGCGLACPDGLFCDGGECRCPTGETRCGNQCVNLQADENHCGGCGAWCDAGFVCSSGDCVLSCQAGLTNCGGRCVDLNTDSSQCGACGLPCGAGQRCEDGYCTAVCGSNTVVCGGQPVDPMTDPFHCGGCGVDCGPMGVCVGGVCDERVVQVQALSTSGCDTATGSEPAILAATSKALLAGAGDGLSAWSTKLKTRSVNGPADALIVSDLATGALYGLAAPPDVVIAPVDEVPQPTLLSGPDQVAAFVVALDPKTGAVETSTPLSQAVLVPAGAGLFSGSGQMAVHTGAALFVIDLQTGGVTTVNLVASLDTHAVCPSGLFSGVLELGGDGPYLTYMGAAGIVRTRPRDGATMLLAAVDGAGLACSVAVSPENGRWYTIIGADGTNSFDNTLWSCPASVATH